MRNMAAQRTLDQIEPRRKARPAPETPRAKPAKKAVMRDRVIATCPSCGKRVHRSSTGKLRPHAVPILKRAVRGKFEFCPGESPMEGTGHV